LKHIEFAEHETHANAFDRPTAEALERSRLGLRIATAGTGHYRIRASSWVGTDQVGGVAVTVRPKLGAARILYIATYAGIRPRYGGRVLLAETTDLFDAIRDAYAHALGRAIEGGLLQAYRQESIEENVVRGRLDFVSLATNRFGQFPPIPCEVDEYGCDVPGNRRLLAAARRLARTSPDHATTRRLLDAARAMDRLGISEGDERSPDRGDRGPIIEAQLGSAAEAYRSALDLADMVLQDLYVRFEAGARPSIGFAMNMNDVFQKFLFRALRRRLPAAGEEIVSELHAPMLRGRAEPSYRPDITWLGRDGKPRLVIDAKWMDVGERRKDHLEQMLIYCAILGVGDAVLVYGRAGRRSSYTVAGFDLRIHVEELDVDCDELELEARVDALAARLAPLGAEPRRAVYA
jgi:5-methylcytosine-specific restriction enzyme subunit McrC